MRQVAAFAILAVFVALFQAGFVSALPVPLALVNLPLILVVGLVTSFRAPAAFAAAFAAGLTADTLSSLPYGSHVLVLVSACTVTVFLFTRVFTHHSRRGNVALHAGAFVLAACMLSIIHAVRGTFSGLPLGRTVTGPWWELPLQALGIQIGAAIAAMLLAAAVRGALGRRFMVRPNAYRPYAR